MTWFDIFRRRIIKLGNSKVITLDKKVLAHAGIDIGDKVDIKIKKVK